MYKTLHSYSKDWPVTLTADEASFADAVAIPAITGWISQYIGVTFDDANGCILPLKWW